MPFIVAVIASTNPLYNIVGIVMVILNVLKILLKFVIPGADGQGQASKDTQANLLRFVFKNEILCCY